MAAVTNAVIAAVSIAVMAVVLIAVIAAVSIAVIAVASIAVFILATSPSSTGAGVEPSSLSSWQHKCVVGIAGVGAAADTSGSKMWPKQ